MKKQNNHIENYSVAGKKFKRLTIEELKTFKGFENYTDEQAEQTIETLVNLSLIFFDLFQKHLEQEENAMSKTVIKNLEPNKKNNNDETRIAA